MCDQWYFYRDNYSWVEHDLTNTLFVLYKSQMIVLPWYVRFGIDCVLVITPFYLIASTS
jgi:hypothetical protein